LIFNLKAGPNEPCAIAKEGRSIPATTKTYGAFIKTPLEGCRRAVLSNKRKTRQLPAKIGAAFKSRLEEQA
jgi:hypothetical protein